MCGMVASVHRNSEYDDNRPFVVLDSTCLTPPPKELAMNSLIYSRRKKLGLRGNIWLRHPRIIYALCYFLFQTTIINILTPFSRLLCFPKSPKNML